MTSLPDPLVEACAMARLIEARAQALASFARTISNTSDTHTVKPEEWRSFSNSFDALLSDLKGDIETFSRKAEYGT
jgi:hypothetical protein